MVAAAYLRIMGATQEAAASSVGRSAKTIYNWEQDERWREAREEAADRWMCDLTDASRKAVLDSVCKGNAYMGLSILERVDARLAPAKQRLEHSGGVAVELGQARREVEKGLEEIASRRAAASTSAVFSSNGKRNGRG